MRTQNSEPAHNLVHYCEQKLNPLPFDSAHGVLSILTAIHLYFMAQFVGATPPVWRSHLTGSRPLAVFIGFGNGCILRPESQEQHLFSVVQLGSIPIRILTYQLPAVLWWKRAGSRANPLHSGHFWWFRSRVRTRNLKYCLTRWIHLHKEPTVLQPRSIFVTTALFGLVCVQRSVGNRPLPSMFPVSISRQPPSASGYRTGSSCCQFALAVGKRVNTTVQYAH